MLARIKISIARALIKVHCKCIINDAHSNSSCLSIFPSLNMKATASQSLTSFSCLPTTKEMFESRNCPQKNLPCQLLQAEHRSRTQFSNAKDPPWLSSHTDVLSLCFHPRMFVRSFCRSFVHSFGRSFVHSFDLIPYSTRLFVSSSKVTHVSSLTCLC